MHPVTNLNNIQKRIVVCYHLINEDNSYLLVLCLNIHVNLLHIIFGAGGPIYN